MLTVNLKTATAHLARWCRIAAFTAAAAIAGGSAAQSQQGFNPSEETPESFPDGAGREETFYACTACHNFKLVAAQGMNRRQWEDSLDWMVSKHGMNPLEWNDRKLVLDYLETAFPPRAPAGGGWQNPFLSK